jgi:hypothetical protein
MRYKDERGCQVVNQRPWKVETYGVCWSSEVLVHSRNFALTVELGAADRSHPKVRLSESSCGLSEQAE